MKTWLFWTDAETNPNQHIPAVSNHGLKLPVNLIYIYLMHHLIHPVFLRQIAALEKSWFTSKPLSSSVAVKPRGLVATVVWEVLPLAMAAGFASPAATCSDKIFLTVAMNLQKGRPSWCKFQDLNTFSWKAFWCQQVLMGWHLVMLSQVILLVYRVQLYYTFFTSADNSILTAFVLKCSLDTDPSAFPQSSLMQCGHLVMLDAAHLPGGPAKSPKSFEPRSLLQPSDNSPGERQVALLEICGPMGKALALGFAFLQTI